MFYPKGRHSKFEMTGRRAKILTPERIEIRKRGYNFRATPPPLEIAMAPPHAPSW
jgi:hypothetical protein